MAKQYLDETGVQYLWGKIKGLVAEATPTKQSLVDTIYPVGSIYMSMNNTEPEVLFGGTWEKIENRFLFAEGALEAGTEGGEQEHTLTVDEMPSHTHTQNAHSHGRSDTNVYVGTTNTASITRTSSAGQTGTKVNNLLASTQALHRFDATGSTTATNQNTGGGAAHNNMPPYMVVYMWKRTA